MRWLIAFIFLVFQGAAFGDDSIGKVVVVEGQASAINSAQGSRVLQRGSNIYVADTIIVASESKAQIKFSDGGILNLIPDTEFRVDEYRYKKFFKKDRFSAELAKGGFRSMSGSIAKKNPDEYEIKTPTSTIGIRGTILEARIVDGQVYVGCESGQAIVRNEAGSTLIGKGAPTQFATIPSRDAKPQPAAQRPPTLQPSLFVEPKGGLNIAREQQKTDTAVNRSPTGVTSGTGTTSAGGEGTAAATSGDSGGGTSTEASGAAEGVTAESEASTAPEDSATSSGDGTSDGSSGGDGAAASSDSGSGGQTFDSFAETSTTDSGDFSGGESTLQSGGGVSISGGC